MTAMVVRLDDIYWAQWSRSRQGREKRDRQGRSSAVWTMEGDYGQMAMVLDRATTLVWIDLPEDECIVNIEQWGARGGKSKTSFDGILKWVAEYRTRRITGTRLKHMRDCSRDSLVGRPVYQAV